MKSFIAAQSDLAAIASKIQSAGDKPDPALQAELEGIAKKHGFQPISPSWTTSPQTFRL